MSFELDDLFAQLYESHLNASNREDEISSRMKVLLDSTKNKRMDFALRNVAPLEIRVQFHQTKGAIENEYTINDLENNPADDSMFHSSFIAFEKPEYQESMLEAYSISGVYGNTRLALAFANVHAIDGIRFETSPYIRSWKYYHELHQKLTGVQGDQFFESGVGMEVQKYFPSTEGKGRGTKKYNGDILYAKRAIFCLNMYLWEVFDIMNEEVRTQLFAYAFNDPQHLLFKLKKLTYHIMQCAGAQFSGGIGYLWMTGSPVENPLVTDDTTVAKYFESALKKDLVEIAELGVPAFAEYSRWLCDKHDFSIEGAQKRVGVGISELSAMLGLIGFTRGNPLTAIKEESKPLDINSDGKAWEETIKLRIKQYLQYNDDMLNKITTQNFGHRVYNAMTSNSSGMPPVSVTVHEGRDGDTQVRSKIFDFLVRGDEYLNNLNYVDAEYWRKEGIGTAFRSQPGRRLRRIVIVPNPVITVEMRFFGNVYRYMKSGPFKEKFFMSNAAGGFADHVEEMTNTGMAMYYTVSGDFDNLDATLKDKNFRSKVDKAVREHLATRTNNIRMFGETDLQAWIAYNKISRRWYLKVGDEIIDYDGVASGEYGTSFYDSISTDSFVETLIYNLSTTVNVRARGLRIQGDDFTVLMEGMADSYYEVLMDQILKTAKSVGLSINRSKLIIRKTYSEVLKVATYVGMLLHRFATIQIFEKEKSTDNVTYIEKISGLKSLLQVAISRGMDPMWGYRYLLSIWSTTNKIVVSKVRRVIRGDEKAVKIEGEPEPIKVSKNAPLVRKEIYYLNGEYPWWLLFAPQAAGGLGLFPYSMVGANLTIVFAAKFRKSKWYIDNGYDFENDAELQRRSRIRKLVGQAAYASYKSKTSSLDQVVATIEKLNEERFNPTSKYRMLDELLVQAREAGMRMKLRGSPLPSSPYEFADKEAVKLAVRGSKLIVPARRRDTEKYNEFLIKNKNVEGDYFDRFDWLDDVLIYEIGTEPTFREYPITNLKGHLDVMLKVIGVGWKKAPETSSIETIFAPLIGHPDFRKDLTADGIFNAMLGYQTLDDIRDALIYMGSPTSVASRLAGKLEGIIRGQGVAVSGILVSLGDPISQYFKRDVESIFQWTDVISPYQVPQVSALLRAISFAIVLTTEMGYYPSHVVMEIKLKTIMRNLMQRAFDMHVAPLVYTMQTFY